MTHVDSQLLHLIKTDGGLSAVTMKMHFATLGTAAASPSVSHFPCFLGLLMRLVEYSHFVACDYVDVLCFLPTL